LTIGAGAHQFCVDDGGAALERGGEGSGKRREGLVDVTAPGDETTDVVLDVGERPESVQFRLENPFRVIERLADA
jgi:hypothetical protein